MHAKMIKHQSEKWWIVWHYNFIIKEMKHLTSQLYVYLEMYPIKCNKRQSKWMDFAEILEKLIIAYPNCPRRWKHM